MASNTQIVANIHRSHRPGKRIWIGVLAAIALVTLPVLPLKFLGIPGPDLDWHSVETLFSKIGVPTTGAQEASEPAEIATPVLSSDIKLMDVTVRSLLAQVSKNPNDPSLHNRVGLVYAELGEPHSAVTHFEESIKLCRQKIKALTITSNQAMEKHDVDKASSCTMEISALNVQLAAAHSSLARVYEQLGKSDRVMAQLSELSKDISLSKVIQPAKAVAIGTAALGTANGAGRLDAETAAWLARADALRQAGRGVEAMAEYKRLSEKVPNLALVHKEYGLTALAMRNLWLAQEELEKAAKLNGNDAATLTALGTIQAQLGERDKAMVQFEKALKVNPKDVNAAFNLGNFYADTGQYDKAISAFQKAVAGQPNFALAHNNLATMYSFAGDSANAAREFRQAIGLSPNMASAHYGLGIACLNEKNYTEAARSFKRALQLNPDLIDAQSKLEVAQKRARGQLKFN